MPVGTTTTCRRCLAARTQRSSDGPLAAYTAVEEVTMARITTRKYDKMVKAAALKIKHGQIIGYRMGGEHAGESEHFYTCKKCGQAVDKRDLGQVFHHEAPNHQPLAESPFNDLRHNKHLR